MIKVEFPSQLVSALLGLISSMYAVGNSIGMLGGSALMLVVSYSEIFYFVAPVVLVFGIAFVCTISKISLSTCKSSCHRVKAINNAPESAEKPKGLRNSLIKLFHLDWIGLFLLASGTVLLLVGLSQVSH